MPVSVDEQRQTIRDLRPPKRSRPLVAILADNRGSETTDFMVPYAVLMEHESHFGSEEEACALDSVGG